VHCTPKGSNAYVTARHNVSYVLDHFPHSNKSNSSNAELSWLHTLLAKSQNKEGSVSSDKSANEIEDVSLYCAESFVEGVGTPEIFLNDNQTSDKGTDINQGVQIALQQLAIPVRETRATAKSKADTEDASFLILNSLHSQDSTLVEQNQKIDISRPKHNASTDVIVAPKFTEGELRANRTLLVGRILVRNFGKLGNFKGVVSSYDAVHEEYRIDFSADNTYGLLSFDDTLTLLPNTWLFKRAQANIACVQLALTTTIFDVAMLKYTGKPAAFVAIASGFTEPGSYAESLTVVDSALWQESMIVEIRQLESMDCWNVVLLTDLPSQSFVIGNKWVFKLRYRDNVFDKRKSRLVALGYQQEKGRDFFESFSPSCSQIALQLILGLTSTIGWRSIDMDALSAFISSKLAVGEHVYMKMPKGFDTLQDTHCPSLNRCSYGLCQSPRAFYMLTREVYINAGFTQLKSYNCVFMKIECNIIGGPASLSPEDVINHGAFVSMSNVPPAQRICPSCPHSAAALFIIVYVDNIALRYNCDEFVEQFEASIRI